MLTNRTKKELAQQANDMAHGYDIVKYNHQLYLPVHFETLQMTSGLAPEDRVWIPLLLPELIDLANDIGKVLFYSDSEKSSFYVMVEQAAKAVSAVPGTVLMVRDGKVVELRKDGKLHDRSLDFCPHFINVPINEDAEAKAEVYATIVSWLNDSEEDAESLLYHLATTLATHWSAVKYVLLIGEGRNGKSVLMKMVMALLGANNVSFVTRQDMAASKSTCLDLQGRLANLVFDGPASYLKDSGPEKSLIAGEVTPIRRLYSSLITPVQTNGLFIEGLNREPKTGDKSIALQKRIVRFQFLKVFELDFAFEAKMLSEPMLGAFLSLLLDHYVLQHEAHKKLSPTSAALELQIEQMYTNSPAMQFAAWFDEDDMIGLESLIGETIPEVAQKFKQWRLVEMSDVSSWADKDVEQILLPLFITERKSKRIAGKVRKVRVITGFRSLLSSLIIHIRGEESTHVDEDDTVVDADAVLHDA